MKLTNVEEVGLMKKSCAINGCTLQELKELMNSSTKADASKVDAIAKTFSQLKSMQLAKKVEMRSDKESKSLLKSLFTKLTPFEEYCAQTKNPDMMKNSAWVKKVFQKGAADSYEKVALLSNSCISIMDGLDPYQVERAHLLSVPGTVRSAGAFCKRFGLK